MVAERAGETRSLLVKWEGLPYCEATWEAPADVMAAQGGQQARDDFLTRQQRLQVCGGCVGTVMCVCGGGVRGLLQVDWRLCCLHRTLLLQGPESHATATKLVAVTVW